MPFDTDPDSVDGMSSHEIFIDNEELRKETSYEASSSLKYDAVPEILASRRALRQKLMVIMKPIVEERITPLVRQQYPDKCTNKAGRACTPCYSLIRRYRPGERRT